MKTLFKALVFAVVCGLAARSFGAAEPGNCISKAVQITPYDAQQQVNVTLVNEWDDDPEMGGMFWDTGVYYFKMTVYKGSECTVWISGGNTENLFLSVDTDFNDDYAPFAQFDYDERDGGATQIAYMYRDAWYDDDPNYGVYYIAISGEIGERCTLYYQKGIHSFKREGEEGNPKRLTVTDDKQTNASTLIDGAYYHAATLEAGRKYRFYTTQGEKSAPLFLDIDGGMHRKEVNPQQEAYNSDFFIYPEETATYNIVVSCNVSPAHAFKLKYFSVPKRKPKNHPNLTTLTAETGYAASMVPGRMLADDNFYDEIVDESLGRVKMMPGERWVFETAGAATNIALRLYDSSGQTLRENTSLGNGSLDCRAAIEATEDAYYYFGVYIPGLAYENSNYVKSAVTVKATKAEDFGYPDGDEYEPADDVSDGATLMTAYPGEVMADVTRVGGSTGIHLFNGEDWYDWFALPCYKGKQYALKAVFATDTKSDVPLAAKVYRMVGGALTKISDTRGDVTPGNSEPFIFNADRSGMFYVRVTTATGPALDYPAYRLHAMVFSGGDEMGMIQGVTKGYDTTWYLKSDPSALYQNGAILAIPAAEGVKVKFSDSKPSTYKVPDQVKTNVTSWAATELVAVAEGKYRDVFDPADDVASGAVTLMPANDVAKAKRTLWDDDLADYFLVKAKAGVYYNFWIEDRQEEAVEENPGDALFSVIRKADGVIVVSPTNEIRRATFEAGKYYVKVAHATESPLDACYFLHYSGVEVGTVGFTAAQYNVRDNAPYVDLTLRRTAAGGRIRLNFATVAGVAEPGKAYYPTNGIVEWASGDMSDRVIRVRLIPHLTDICEQSRKFQVRIWPMAEDCLDSDDEYIAVLNEIGEAATVKVKDSATADPGEVSVVCESLKVNAGSELKFKVYRSGERTEGRVAVKVKTGDGTALSGTDYDKFKETFVWEHGETNSYERTIAIKPGAGGKQFTLKAQVQTSGDYAGCLTPVVTTPAQTVSIVGADVAMTMAELNALVADKGVTLGSKSTTMYVDGAGAYRSEKVAAGTYIKAKFTVEGAGEFVCRPSVLGGTGRLICTPGSGAAFDVTTEEVRVYIPSGAQTVTFKLKDTDGQAYLSFADMGDGAPFEWIPDVIRTEDEIAAAVGDQGVSVSFAGEGCWYEDANGVFRSDAIAEGTYAKMKVKVTGPGFIVCRAAVKGGAGKILCTPGDAASFAAVSNELLVAAVNGGAQTVTFKLKDTDGKAYAAFEPVTEDGLPFKWVPFADMAAAAPTHKALVRNPDRIVLGLPAALTKQSADSPVCWRIRIGKTSSAADLAATGDVLGEWTSVDTEFELPTKYAVPGDKWYWIPEFSVLDEQAHCGQAIVIPSTCVWRYSVADIDVPDTLIEADATDAYGNPIEVGKEVKLAVGVPTQFKLDSNKIVTGLTLQRGALPDGMRFVESTAKIKGTPAKAGDYSAVFQIQADGKAGTSLKIDFHVVESGSAFGASFNGVLKEDGSGLTNRFPRIARLTVTTTESGVITAKAKIDGQSVKFTNGTFSEVVWDGGEFAKGLVRKYQAVLKNTSTVNGVDYVNELKLVIGSGALDNLVALGESVGTAELVWNVPDAAGVQEGVHYACELFRDNTGVPLHKSVVKSAFKGYYTVSLVPECVSVFEGLPAGNGFLTLMVDKYGAVQVAGRLADGTAISASTVAQLQGDLQDPEKCTLCVPLCVSVAPNSLGGVLRLSRRNATDGETRVDAAAVDSQTSLEWNKDGKKASAAKLDFCLPISPVGGWYNTEYNLQAYYLNRDFTVEAEPIVGLPPELLPEGFACTIDTVPHGVGVNLNGNALEVQGQAMVTDADDSSRYDLAHSVNPWKTKFSFDRTTGLVSGQFKIWGDDGVEQVKSSWMDHYGILLMTRDAYAPLDLDVWTAGFGLIPVNSKWTMSIPFNIRFQSVDRDWNDAVIP